MTQSPHPVETTSPRQITTSLLAALSLFTATTVGQVVELLPKATNPDGVDVSARLAYLRPILITTFALIVVALLATIASIVRLGRAEGRAATPCRGRCSSSNSCCGWSSLRRAARSGRSSKGLEVMI